ncbi:MAG: hypothetical protein U0787_23090 [Polyangia bacterium]
MSKSRGTDGKIDGHSGSEAITVERTTKNGGSDKTKPNGDGDGKSPSNDRQSRRSGQKRFINRRCSKPRQA